MQERFKAGTQYGDWKGTSAADDHDRLDMRHYLEGQGLLKGGEQIVGIEMFSGEVHKETQDEKIYVTVLVAEAKETQTIKEMVNAGEILRVRKISIHLHLNEFFGLFKRFELCISRYGMLDGRDYEGREE